METLVELVGHLAWPLSILLVLFLLKREISDILKAIKKRIQDPRTQVSIGKEGVTLDTKLDVVESQVESLQIDQEQFKQMVLAVAGQASYTGVKETETQSDEIPHELLKLADEYLRISIPDLGERLRKKEQYAQHMTNLVLSQNISRDMLADQHNEGLILALVGAIHAFPKEGDLERLFRISTDVSRLHVRYRIVIAFGRLVERLLVERTDIQRTNEVLDDYLHGADKPLVARIKRTRAFMEEKFREGE